MPAALDGVRVLDLSRLVPGPFCTMLLADLGADVVKVEEAKPKFRHHAVQAPGAAAQKESEHWGDALRVVERNKRSIGLNLKSKAGQQAFHRLAKTADVVVEGFRPGVVDRLGISYQTIKAINPRIIYCAITGYGQTGPYRDYPGHDINYESTGGLLSILCTPQGEPIAPAIPLANVIGGFSAAVSILAALRAREKSGKGQYVDLALTDGVAMVMALRYGAAYFANGAAPKYDAAPSRVFQTKDGRHISVNAGEPWFWERLCKATGLTQYLPDHMTIRASPRENPRTKEILEAYQRAFLTRTRQEWLDILREADACVAPVYTFQETFSDPQLLAREMVVTVDHHKLGKTRTVGTHLKLSETPAKVRTLSPILGEHTEEILKEAGYATSDIKALREQGDVS